MQVTLRDNRRKVASALLVLAALSILIGLDKILPTDVDCGGSTMTEGSVCEHRGANARTLTVDEQRADNRTYGIIALASSVPLLFLSVRGFVRARKPLPVYTVPDPVGPAPGEWPARRTE